MSTLSPIRVQAASPPGAPPWATSSPPTAAAPLAAQRPWDPGAARGSAGALAAALELCEPGRVLVLGCGSPAQLPVEQLRAIAGHVDFVDVNGRALEAVRAALDGARTAAAAASAGSPDAAPAAAAGSTAAYHVADVTGLADPVDHWCRTLVAPAADPDACLAAMGAALSAAEPVFWAPAEGGRYDLVAAPQLLTQLHVRPLHRLERAFRARFPEQAGLLRSSRAWKDAVWRFARGLEERFVRHLATLCRPGGVVFLSDTVRFRPLFRAGGGRSVTGAALLMTRTDRLADYVSAAHERLGEWSWTERHPAGPGEPYGHHYDCQAVAYRPAGAIAAAVPESVSRAVADPAPASPSRRRRPGWRLNAYLAWGLAGYLSGAALLLGLAAARGLSPWLMALVVALAPLTTYGLIAHARRRGRQVRLTYLRVGGAYLAAAWLFLLFLPVPVLPYLELALVGTVAFQVLGRFGCLSVGCCHGRPFRPGIRYGTRHVGTGFPAHLAGVPLFPLPLIDSLIGLLSAGVAAAVLLAGAPAGEGAATAALLLALGRFCSEEARGDAGRPYLGPLSEAQWSALAIAAAVLALEWAGVLPHAGWHLLPAAALALGALVLAARRLAARGLPSARHLDEIARLVHAWDTDLQPAGAPVAVERTAAGLLLSTGTVELPERARLYSMSRAGSPLTAREARRLARWLELLLGARGRLVPGSNGVFHLAIAAGAAGAHHGV